MAAKKSAAKKIGWGILGTGNIAKTLANAVINSKTGKLVAVGSRTQAAADKFGEQFKIPNCYGTYEAVLKDKKVDAIYISLPNHLHALWTIRCAEAGKAILCEKPLGMNFPESMAMIEACRSAGVFMLEAFMYRCHPQTAKLVELIKAKTIGEVRLIQSAFSYNIGDNAWENIRMRADAGGGGILDVGCYTASMSRLIAGAAMGKDFADPTELKAIAHIGEKGKIDEWSVATARFPGNIIAELACGTRINSDRTVRIWGSAGHILVPNPWFPGEKDNQIIVHKAGEKEPQTIKVDGGAGLYSIEVDTVAANINKDQAPTPCMTWADSLSNMRMLDLWRKQVGLTFEYETIEGGMKLPVNGRKLAPRKDNTMAYAKVEGVKKPVSRVVMGTMIYHTGDPALTFSMCDYFVESGGNCFDLAYVYGGGQSEKAIGQWVKARGNRKDLVIMTKGAHTPQCDPVNLTKQLNESLERLQMDYVDMYCMHRDNLDLPVSAFVDVLNEHKKAGRIGAFGGSNWSTARIQEANEYAKKRGLTPFTISSPNFSLATWNGPMWAGCITASDRESRAWYTKHQLALFAWSSQAGGFFTGRLSRPDIMNDPDWYAREGAKTWLNEINNKKLARATELAAKKKTTATQIAMAYVLSQPFPTFALFGPRTIEEARTSILGVGLKLTAKELKWLNLEA